MSVREDGARLGSLDLTSSHIVNPRGRGATHASLPALLFTFSFFSISNVNFPRLCRSPMRLFIIGGEAARDRACALRAARTARTTPS